MRKEINVQTGEAVTINETAPSFMTDELRVGLLEDERDRRLALGFSYDFQDARGVHQIGTTNEDMTAWTREVTPYAQALIANGDTVTKITIKTETGVAEVTATEWMDILLAAATVRQQVWSSYFTIKAMKPIPSDCATNESYWAR